MDAIKIERWGARNRFVCCHGADFSPSMFRVRVRKSQRHFLLKKKTRREGEQCRSDSPCVYKLKEKQLKVYKKGDHMKNKKKERDALTVADN